MAAPTRLDWSMRVLGLSIAVNSSHLQLRRSTTIAWNFKHSLYTFFRDWYLFHDFRLFCSPIRQLDVFTVPRKFTVGTRATVRVFALTPHIMPFFTRICKYMAHNKGFRQSYIVLARQYCAETVPTLNIDKRPPKKPRKSSGEVKRLSVADPELQALCAKFPKLFGRRSSRPENIYHVHSEAIG